MNYGVTQELIDTYGEIVFKLSLNKQTRYGDPVRELNFDAIEEQRAGTGLTDAEIAEKIGLLPEQVSIVRGFVESFRVVSADIHVTEVIHKKEDDIWSC